MRSVGEVSAAANLDLLFKIQQRFIDFANDAARRGDTKLALIYDICAVRTAQRIEQLKK